MAISLELKQNSALLVTDEYSKRYFSEIYGVEGSVIITSKEIVYLTDARYFYALEQKLKNSKVKPLLYKSIDSVKEYLNHNSIEKLYIDFNTTTLTEYENYKAFNIELKNGSEFISACRMAKSKKEIENIKKACDIASKAFDYIIPFIKEGVTEISIKNRLERFMKKLGAEGASFETIVAFGKNSAVPHHQTAKTKLKKDQAVLLDYGALYNGYASDITRTVFYGNPTKKFIDTFNTVANANLLGMQNSISGQLAKEVDRKVREYFDKLGVLDKFKHSLGHGVGLQIHEEPYLSPKGKGELKENYAFTIEPGLYYDGEFGVRIENTVIIENGRAVSLTGNGRELIIIK